MDGQLSHKNCRLRIWMLWMTKSGNIFWFFVTLSNWTCGTCHKLWNFTNHFAILDICHHKLPPHNPLYTFCHLTNDSSIINSCYFKLSTHIPMYTFCHLNCEVTKRIQVNMSDYLKWPVDLTSVALKTEM